MLSVKRIATNFKTYALAGMVALSSCTGQLKKDVFEFTHPETVKLLTSLENGERHSKTIVIKDIKKRVIPQNEIEKFREVADSVLQKCTMLPDTIETYYRVYKGAADQAIQKAKKKANNLVTVGHGNIGRDQISLANGKKAKEGDYVSKYAVDSLCNISVNEKDSILRNNITEEAYKKLNKNQKKAILTYLYNINETLLRKSDPKRAIPESFFECLNKFDYEKAQAKFNVRPSAKAAEHGLMKRNLVQLLAFGNGKVYGGHAQKNFEKIISSLNKREDFDILIKEVFDILIENDISKKNLKVTKAKIQDIVQKNLIARTKK